MRAATEPSPHPVPSENLGQLLPGILRTSRLLFELDLGATFP
jgi:hypothetical protein